LCTAALYAVLTCTHICYLYNKPQLQELNDKVIAKEAAVVLQQANADAQLAVRESQVRAGLDTITAWKLDREREGDLLGQDSAEKLQYLKNVVLKFFASDAKAREQLTPVIATVLKLSPSEAGVLRNTAMNTNSSATNAGGWSNLFSSSSTSNSSTGR
jgi:GRIP domain